MSKVAIFTDLHSNAWNEFSTVVEYRKEKLNSRLVDCLHVIDSIAKYVDAHSIRHVIFAGDLFHRRRLLEVIVYNSSVKALYRLAKVLKSLTLLVGNHDLVTRSSGGEFSAEHALDILSKRKNIDVVDKPRIVLDTVGMVPYTDDLDTMKRGLEEVQVATMCVLHAGIAGAKTGVIEHQPLEALQLSDLPKVPIYSGHYHRPQQLSDGSSPVVYVGAPLEFVRGEGYDKKRGFIVVDLNKPKKFERAPLKGPRFVKMNASDDHIRNDVVRGNFIDLLLDDLSRTPESMVKMLMGHGARAVNPVPYEEPKSKKARVKVKTKRGLPSVEDLCEAYISTASKDLDHEKLRRIAKNALQAAKE